MLSGHFQQRRWLAQPWQTAARCQYRFDVITGTVNQSLDRFFSSIRVMRNHGVKYFAVHGQ